MPVNVSDMKTDGSQVGITQKCLLGVTPAIVCILPFRVNYIL